MQLHADNVSGFDTRKILIKRFCDKHIVDILTNGKGNISMKVFKSFMDNNSNKETPQYLIFRYGMTHLNCS